MHPLPMHLPTSTARRRTCAAHGPSQRPVRERAAATARTVPAEHATLVVADQRQRGAAVVAALVEAGSREPVAAAAVQQRQQGHALAQQGRQGAAQPPTVLHHAGAVCAVRGAYGRAGQPLWLRAPER